MAQLMFLCPYTNKPIHTGIELDAASITKMGTYPISIRCQHCGIDHHGTIGDGQLTAEPPQQELSNFAA